MLHRINIAYQTTDPKGNPCRMSGVIIIPKDVWDGEQICDGMVLYNHYAQLAKKDAPSRGYAMGEDMVLANPLNPNYIMVIPDFYGFGITIAHSRQVVRYFFLLINFPAFYFALCSLNRTFAADLCRSGSNK